MFILIKQSKKRFFQCKVAILSILIILSSGEMVKPIDPTTIFYDTDELVYLLLNFEYVTTSHSIIVKWYDPEDKLYGTNNDQITNPKLEGYDYRDYEQYYWSMYIKD